MQAGSVGFPAPDVKFSVLESNSRSAKKCTMSEIRKIGICTGGGDCPGLNAVIRAVVKTAILKYRFEVIGIHDGFDGLIWPEKVIP